jgi:aminobenzoyl-glutamate utilization protein B
MAVSRSVQAIGAAYLLLSLSPSARAEPPVQDDPAHAAVLADLQRREPITDQMAKAIWDEPELGYLEFKTSQRMILELKRAGFSVRTGVAGMPTAFVAEWGSGGPLIGILAEMDALPGKSQAEAPVEQEMPGRVNNQACGHNLFAAGSVAAAIAVRDWLQRSGTPGRVRLYGTPAEEGGSGKVYLARAGEFTGVDVVLHWHPAMLNAGAPVTNNAVLSAKFRFRGIASHAASAPERGRSALEGVEAMDHMVDMVRAHVRDGARISYIITKGGDAPNVVPENAEVYYYVREADAKSTRELFERIVKAAQGAALGTETQVSYELIHGSYNLLPNETLAKVVDDNLRRQVHTLVWTPQEHAFAARIYESLTDKWLPLDSIQEVQPFKITHVPGSSDVGDVSWLVPTTGVVTQTWVPASDAHTWQAAATGRMGIGLKGMHLASEVIAMTATDLYRRPALIAAAKAEFEGRRGADFRYEPLIGNRAPPLDYRRTSQPSAP